MDLNTSILLIVIAILSSLGMYFHIIALSKARASIIQPFHYTLVFWSIIFGFIFYQHLPDILTILGAVYWIFLSKLNANPISPVCAFGN